MAGVLRAADVAMVNLESAIARPGRTPEGKELEVPSLRYHFRTSPAALEVLDEAGIDVVTMANNHGADYGPAGLRDTLAAARTGPVRVLGVGRNRAAALAPHLVTIRGTDLAFFAADSSTREGASSVWAADRDTPGIADARAPEPRALLTAVRAASRQVDVVVVYLHWGAESVACPTPRQRITARALAEAGADVVVGTHAHVQLGSGWLGDTYVNYGLGNFLWYHNRRPDSGVLTVRIRDGEVVGDAWNPARIGTDGIPRPVVGEAAGVTVAGWRALRGCTGLSAAKPR
jgi:poly-gamma-glutamate synthesis protein (capsule biosynthesis protein)